MSNPAILALVLMPIHVEVLETNHVFREDGKLVFDQVIVWERNPANGKMNVRSWYIAEQPISYPTKNEISGLWEATYTDANNNQRRKLTSKVFRETWGDDNERKNKVVWPEELRNQLPDKRVWGTLLKGKR